MNTVILVHRKLLADQWLERINQFLDIPKKDIGYYSGAKKKRTGFIDVVAMQSIVKKNTVVDWISDYGQIIVDECHHISAASYRSNEFTWHIKNGIAQKYFLNKGRFGV